VPVELFSASRTRTVGLRMLAPDGTPLARRYVSTKTDRELDADEIARGYEIGTDQFVVVSEDELDKLAPRRSRDIDLESFVDRDSIDPAFFVKPFLVLPAEGQTKAYRLLAESMESNRRAAIARFVMRGKSYAIAIFADRGLLRAETLRFGDEVRSADAIGASASEKPKPAEVERMARAIDELARDEVDPSELESGDAGALLDRARAKLAKGKDVIHVRTPEGEEATDEDSEEGKGEVIDLFALIDKRMRESVKRPRSVRATKSKERERPVKTATARGRARKPAR
jgi:DNA end-binding protein Ku